MYFVYILECSDKSLYTWITTDLERRLYEHNNTNKWAKYTKNKRPVKIVYFTSQENRSLATKKELSIKKLSKEEKIKLITNH